MLGAVALVGFMGWAAGCSSIESQAFSNGDCVAGGCAQSTTSSSGGTTSSAASSSSSSGECIVDQSCTISWKTDIYAGIFDTNVGCTNATLCHGSPASKGGITMDPGMANANAAYGALNSYTLLPGNGPVKKYIAPCDKAGSGMLCNMVVDDGMGGDGNTFKPACGSPMPKGGVHKLTTAQLTTIADWITCGAPEN